MTTRRRHTKAYRDALEGPRWRALSAGIRQHGQCEACLAYVPAKALQAHHWHYDTLGNEGHWDLSPLCAECHTIADAQRRTIIRAAKRYCLNNNDDNVPRAIRLLGRAVVMLRRVPSSGHHTRITLRALGYLP